MKTETGKFNFTIPTNAIDRTTGQPHPGAGKEKLENLPFTFQVCESDEDVQKVMADKKWSITEMVNDALKSNARASAYQTKLAEYAPVEVSAEDIRARMIKDFIRIGIASGKPITEEEAAATVDAVLNR